MIANVLDFTKPIRYTVHRYAGLDEDRTITVEPGNAIYRQVTYILGSFSIPSLPCDVPALGITVEANE